MPDFSIGIVTKDRSETVNKTLQRLSEQGLDDKVIVVDGSEESGTEKVCSDYDVDYYLQDSGGRVRARNIALENCDSDYLVFIDDDVLVSSDWFEQVRDTLSREGVVGVTGRLEGESVSFSGFAGRVRDFLFGGRDVFGEILDNGVINGDFFYDEEKRVDHLVGCNMGFDVDVLERVGGFNEDYEVGNAYREETEPSYLVGLEGDLVYNPDASVNHLEVEDVDLKVTSFYVPYLTKYFLHRNNIVSGLKGRAGYFLNKLAKHFYFFFRSVSGLNTGYLYYLYGDVRSFLDFVVFDRKPREYI